MNCAGVYACHARLIREACKPLLEQVTSMHGANRATSPDTHTLCKRLAKLNNQQLATFWTFIGALIQPALHSAQSMVTSFAARSLLCGGSVLPELHIL